MSKINGEESFAIPSDGELEEYIQKSKLSIKKMEKGKKPVYFLSKAQRQKRFEIITIVLSFIIMALLISFPFYQIIVGINSLNSHPSYTNNTTTTSTNLLTSIEETTIPEGNDDLDKNSITEKINQLEPIVEETIMSNLTMNQSLSNNSEIEQIIFKLSEFGQSSTLYDAGRQILREYFIENIKNHTIRDRPCSKNLYTLRSMVSYNYKELNLNNTETEYYLTYLEELWAYLNASFDVLTATIKNDNGSDIRYSEQQLLALNIIVAAINNNYNSSNVNIINVYRQLVVKISEVVSHAIGLPMSFLANNSFFSEIYLACEQASLVLALENIVEDHSTFSLIDEIKTKIDQFISNYLIRKDWSCSSYYNSSGGFASPDTKTLDTSLVIRSFVKLRKLTFSLYMASSMIKNLELENNSYKTSTTNNSIVLLDQLEVLLAFYDLIRLIVEIEPTTNLSEGQPSPAFLAVEIILTSLLFLIIRRIKKKRNNINKNYKE